MKNIFKSANILNSMIVIPIFAILLAIMFSDMGHGASEEEFLNAKGFSPVRKYEIDNGLTIYEFDDKKYNHCVVARLYNNSVSIVCENK